MRIVQKIGMSIACMGFMVISTISLAQTTSSAPAFKPEKRWLSGSNINLRSLPMREAPVLARLPFAQEVLYFAPASDPFFCDIQSADQRGFVACQYLSESVPIASPAMPSASQAAAPSQRRWVSGTNVNLRELPTLTATILAKMALNTQVNLISAPAGSGSNNGYCQVELFSANQPALKGFTGCQFLAAKAIEVPKLAVEFLADGVTPNPEYNPQRAFDLSPSYSGLIEYGKYLERTRLKRDANGKFTPDVRLKVPEFERMKAHLAKGIYSPPAAQYASWDDAKQIAAELDGKRIQNAKTKTPTEDRTGLINLADQAKLSRLSQMFKLYQLDSLSEERRDGYFPKLPSLINSIELPSVTQSLFLGMSDIAAPSEGGAAALSGRFGLIHSYTTKGRTYGDNQQYSVLGIWDIGQTTVSLTQPVIKTTIFRDGRLSRNSSFGRVSFFEYGESDGPMCEGHSDGYAFGSADPKIWDYFSYYDPRVKNTLAVDNLKTIPRGSLLYFFTREPLVNDTATVTVLDTRLDRNLTGFKSAKSFYFDLNSDGIIDLAVWEGTGIGPGHLEGPTKTDDAYQRLFFVNIAGRWRVLDSDSFSYGCGC